MAVTSIWDIKGRIYKVINYATNPEKTSEDSLDYLAALHSIEGVVEYASNRIKTEKQVYVTGINCDPDIAARQFMNTKKHWGKTDGIIAFHGYQSFLPGEVDAKAAHEIGITLANELWGDRFEVVVATHVNTGHYHNHFVLNSVSFKDGLRYYDQKKSYRLMRAVSDRLCRDYRLSVIDSPVGRGKHYSEWAAESNGKPTYRSTIRGDIDRAILAATTERDFYKTMHEMGYEFKTHGDSGIALKYPALKPPGAQGFFRFHKLGEMYTLNIIRERILQNIRKQRPFPATDQTPRQHYRYRGRYPQHRKITGLHALYLRYCYELRILQKRPASVKRLTLALREDLIKLDKYIAQTRFLVINRIETQGELEPYRLGLISKISSVTEQRRLLRNELRRVCKGGDMESTEQIKHRISGLSAELKMLRKEMAMCEDIAARSELVRAALEQLSAEKQVIRKENSEHELLRGCSRTSRSDYPERC